MLMSLKFCKVLSQWKEKNCWSHLGIEPSSPDCQIGMLTSTPMGNSDSFKTQTCWKNFAVDLTDCIRKFCYKDRYIGLWTSRGGKQNEHDFDADWWPSVMTFLREGLISSYLIVRGCVNLASAGMCHQLAWSVNDEWVCLGADLNLLVYNEFANEWHAKDLLTFDGSLCQHGSTSYERRVLVFVSYSGFSWVSKSVSQQQGS